MSNEIWLRKLAAWLHDPAEKAFVLLHDPLGHEGGTIRVLREELKLDTDNKVIKRADRWAAAADRPQWPRNKEDGFFQPWSQVRFAEKPVLIHPLSGAEYDLKSLQEIDFNKVKAVSLDHFRALISLGGDDPRMRFLAFWRFGPEIHAKDLGALWGMLPADTRVPDHSIWNHLDTASALAGASEKNENPALLSMSFGPVQSFIAQARSTSDLWAGSHLLSSLVWVAMKSIAEEIGPDAFVFPQIRGLPIVDTWLLELAKSAGKEQEWKECFKDCPWLNRFSDSNPLFSASIPNKFLAIVPRSKAKELAEKAKETVQQAAKELAQKAGGCIFEDEGYWQAQIQAQLEGFPEVFWAANEWPESVKGVNFDVLRTNYELFVQTGSHENFFGQPAWERLSKPVSIDGVTFFEPNSGVIYPAVFTLSEKLLGSIKTTRDFEQLRQEGFRCTLCGEREWLANDKKHLFFPPGERSSLQTAWSVKVGSFGLKEGEHLCAVCTLKRLWPTLFVKKVKEYLETGDVSRFVISTHTMALATTLETLKSKADQPKNIKRIQTIQTIQTLCDMVKNEAPVALPRKLFGEISNCSDQKLREVIRRLPSAFDSARENNGEERIEKLEKFIEDITGCRQENYYALLLMDGDNMGAWLSGGNENYQLKFKEAWHPNVRNAVENKFSENPELQAYLDSYRPSSPARHAAISQALNSFSNVIAPFVIEEMVNGKLIYAGGDDALAMVAVNDILQAMRWLRFSYSGLNPKWESELNETEGRLKLSKGFALLNNRLMQVMGERATASVGVAIVHHQTPLSIALRALREAERHAKTSGRNSFCLRILKRSGGEVEFVAPWYIEKDMKDSQPGLTPNSPFGVLWRLKKALGSDESFSRRAVYSANEWLAGMPDWPGQSKDQEWRAMATALLSRQFLQHGGESYLAELAKDTVLMVCQLACACEGKMRDPRDRLINFLSIAEFLARESRIKNEELSQEAEK